MNATDTTARATLADRARSVRIDALTRLMEIAYDDPKRYDPAVLVARSHTIPVLWRDALCRTHRAAPSGPMQTCGRCGAPSGELDERLHAEVVALAPVAQGQTFAVMDALNDGHLPQVPDDPPPVDMADLTAALTEWASR